MFARVMLSLYLEISYTSTSVPFSTCFIQILNSFTQLSTVDSGQTTRIRSIPVSSALESSVCARVTTCSDLPRPMQCARMHPEPGVSRNRSKDSQQASYINLTPFAWCGFSCFTSPLSHSIRTSDEFSSTSNTSFSSGRISSGFSLKASWLYSFCRSATRCLRSRSSCSAFFVVSSRSFFFISLRMFFRPLLGESASLSEEFFFMRLRLVSFGLAAFFSSEEDEFFLMRVRFFCV
uniref:Putative secreted protein n=1 Tax=Anopheles marajoara TaxID=58244 RepID=A0A2M4C5W2_9DIPT